jgi:starch synthase (maltosyl-transferring)
VLYLPPIHPIGRTNRKGPNNALRSRADDPGSPWAIGGEAGGHTDVHPGLGTIADFDRLVARAAELGIEIALDYAVQCSVDHPWLREHPEWFAWRPDGSVKYAENPPKRYQDIVNVRFDTDEWGALWQALLDVVRYWISHGVRVFRVDNPHTKPLAFWEWLIAEVRRDRPDAVFLSEAFTRPAMMHALAKVGFSQSYTYFTWRNTKSELCDYITELAGDSAEYFRPNFFTNTPDILHEYLQRGGRPAFEARLVLAATLSPSYGIYSGFERCEATPLHAGSEEYLDSEKYQVRRGEVGGALLPLAARLNEIRRACPAFRDVRAVTLLETANDSLIAYAKGTGPDAVIVCVNLDPHAAAEGIAEVGDDLGMPREFDVVDLVTDERYTWATGRNYVLLDPGAAHVLAIA